jgi:hypothetical protein
MLFKVLQTRSVLGDAFGWSMSPIDDYINQLEYMPAPWTAQ